jgi:hypothetical protein
MKTFVLTFLCVSSFGLAKGFNCTGIQDAKGLKGQIQLLNKTTLELSYATQTLVERKCVFTFDKDYHPRTRNPQKDRYYITNPSVNCGAELVSVSKSLLISGSGFVDMQFECRGGGGCAHGEAGPIESFVCRL